MRLRRFLHLSQQNQSKLSSQSITKCSPKIQGEIPEQLSASPRILENTPWQVLLDQWVHPVSICQPSRKHSFKWRERTLARNWPDSAAAPPQEEIRGQQPSSPINPTVFHQPEVDRDLRPNSHLGPEAQTAPLHPSRDLQSLAENRNMMSCKTSSRVCSEAALEQRLRPARLQLLHPQVPLRLRQL